MRPRLSLEEFLAGVAAKDRRVLAQAITLVESDREEDRALSAELLDQVAPLAFARRSDVLRLGVGGPPGVGKSTLIEALGMHFIRNGRSLAVLAVDPSSVARGGSILGDKSRMPQLAREERAYVRPSPTNAHLGGLTHSTREAMTLCEAFGYQVILLETVGIGQSEVEVAELVDLFLLLALPGAGDELQGIKRGVMELADLVVVTKADGDNLMRARDAVSQMGSALRHFRPRHDSIRSECLAVSALVGEGVAALYDTAVRMHNELLKSGELDKWRAANATRALYRSVEDLLVSAFREDPAVRDGLQKIASSLEQGEGSPRVAARRLVASFVAKRLSGGS